ncbi:B-cell CLL/lymphoma 7 protein family member A [Amborella trichopoda]|uniref:Uncharacterized protein n=1 Tax=Amborella trichopoda TaxID=13333 RepID=W1NQC5_AMBTC|nr:B-cell CLL/lymphoma 7 protein family member A [Amborella trichopoda]ERM96994.1 hypothetical protein AMTR_s00074p00189770 [Amborella trichopoda]|eukprot:XP_006829578.1 B-cell CLL/lymphoma 7 protein family member A [Amborella trichopoda]
MEGGTRMGSRSSTRYGPAAVFTGPVRKWKKKWVHISPPNSNPTSSTHLRLYKWTASPSTTKDDDSATPPDTTTTPTQEEPPRRRVRYVPVAVLEEQRKEASEKVDEETKPSDTTTSSPGTTKHEGLDGEAEPTEVAMEDAQAVDKDQPGGTQLSSSLDLNLGLKAESTPPNSLERENGPISKMAH